MREAVVLDLPLATALEPLLSEWDSADDDARRAAGIARPLDGLVVVGEDARVVRGGQRDLVPTRSVQNVAPCLRYCVFWTPDAVFVAVSATGTSVLYQRESPRGPAGDAAPGPSSTPCACGLGGREACYLMASRPRLPVRVRTASSTGVTKILPSPICLVLSEATMALTMRSTSFSNTPISTFILGWKRYSWALTSSPRVKPFCTPKPFTSATDMPRTPSTASASATVSRLYGWM